MAAPKAKQSDVPDNDQGPKLLQADIDLRNHFAAIAFREIVAWQIVNGKAGQEDVAASWAFRYGDRALAQSKKAPKGAPVMVRGHQEPVYEQPLPPDIEANMRETIAEEIPGGMIPST